MSSTRKSINNDIDIMNSLRDFIVSNEEIAAVNMRKIRSAVVNRRDFLKELAELYNEVKRTYEKEYEEIKNKKKKKVPESEMMAQRKGRIAAVLLSTNDNLYGDVVSNTYNFFKKNFDKKTTDAVIVGKTGRRIFEEEMPGVTYTYFDYPDSKMDSDQLKNIVMHIISYEKVVVFHSKFETLMQQTPTAFIISDQVLDVQSDHKATRYIFEPSLEQIIEYFDKEIFASIFEQTVHESHLSKFASRMVTLDQASENIKNNLKKLSNLAKRNHHSDLNKQQVNALTRTIIMRRR